LKSSEAPKQPQLSNAAQESTETSPQDMIKHFLTKAVNQTLATEVMEHIKKYFTEMKLSKPPGGITMKSQPVESQLVQVTPPIDGWSKEETELHKIYQQAMKTYDASSGDAPRYLARLRTSIAAASRPSAGESPPQNYVATLTTISDLATRDVDAIYKEQEQTLQTHTRDVSASVRVATKGWRI
jgi:hypothetical protein